MNDQEFLEQRLDLCNSEAWGLLIEEITSMAQSLENIKKSNVTKDNSNIKDEKKSLKSHPKIDN